MDQFTRLSDRILTAIELALEQEDVQMAELLMPALEHAMTRCVGGGEFVERRTYPPQLLAIFERIEALKSDMR